MAVNSAFGSRVQKLRNEALTETAGLWGGGTWHGALSISYGWKREDGAVSGATPVSLLCCAKTTHTNTSPHETTSTHKCTNTHTGGWGRARVKGKQWNPTPLENVTRPLLTGTAPRQMKTAGRLWWAEWKCVSVWELLHRLTVTSVHSLRLPLHLSVPHRRAEEAQWLQTRSWKRRQKQKNKDEQ